MATVITSECINCGACEPECPNTAIYAGGVQWELNGATHPAIAQDIYYITPEKCTECVGFYDHEACAAVCPVDCCVPDPKIPETEPVLLARARTLHPEQTFPDDPPSRFRKEGGAPAPAAAEGANGAAPAPKSAAAAAPAPTAAKPAAPPPAASAPVASAIAAPIAMVNLPNDIGALPAPLPEKHFAGELNDDFDAVVARVDTSSVSQAPAPVQVLMRLGEPLLGAMPDAAKAQLEAAVGNPAAFSRARATALNIIVNLILYPAILAAIAVVVLGDRTFSQQSGGWILLGLLLATGETVWRLREGILHGKPAAELIYRASVYGVVLGPLGALLARGPRLRKDDRKVAFDGFTSDLHDEKLERDRRYGTVYTVREFANAYLVRLEMPRRLPASSLKRLWNLPDAMPDYDYNISLTDAILTINASVRGEALRRLSYVSSAFPADFMTRIDFDKVVGAFKHRMHDKILDIIVLRGEPQQVQDAA